LGYIICKKLKTFSKYITNNTHKLTNQFRMTGTTNNQYMQELLDRGVAVIPYPEFIRKNFDCDTFLSGQKEFIRSDKDTTKYVMGGFGAFGNPSSFHHEEVRKLRLSVFKYMHPLFEKTFKGQYLEGIVDRFAKREPGTSVSPESWHRDISNVKKKKTHGEPGDIIYGGWVNLDETNTQYFTCVPSTHTEEVIGSGFAKITKADIPDYNSKKEKISVPPNHLIIFNEKLVHAVTPSKIKIDTYRLFMKYRITRNPICPLFDPAEISKIIDEQGVFPLSLEQTPPMYSKIHMVNWRKRVEEFSLNFHPQFLEQKKLKTETETTSYVKRIMPSLKQAGLDLFSPYNDEEKQMLTLVQL